MVCLGFEALPERENESWQDREVQAINANAAASDDEAVVGEFQADDRAAMAGETSAGGGQTCTRVREANARVNET